VSRQPQLAAVIPCEQPPRSLQLVGLLERNWYTQNYVAEFFLVVLPRIATTEDQRKRLISAIRTACDNDAKIVKQKVALLPQAWQDAIMSN
jgi:hypothetical protein